MVVNTKKAGCLKCKEFRELPLHLHELALFSELLKNKHIVYSLVKKDVVQTGHAFTMNIAKWLRLASQIKSVELNPYQYEEAHFYCEPVADMLDSNANHHTEIITPLTRFVFVANALEESYRFASPLYERLYGEAKALKPNLERKRNYSAQVAWLLDGSFSNIDTPTHYSHKVENFQAILKLYEQQFDVTFDVSLSNSDRLSYGLSLVRNIRNQIAHGVFPIIEDPEYTLEFSHPKTKNMILNLLGYASRIAAMNIQIILDITNDGFDSEAYTALFYDPDYGDRLGAACTFEYLRNLHVQKKFGLNESAQWSLRSSFDEE